MKWAVVMLSIACVVGWGLLFLKESQETQRQALRLPSINSLAKLNVEFLAKNGFDSAKYLEAVSQWAEKQKFDEADNYVRAVKKAMEVNTQR